MSELDDYLELVRRLGTGGINRSENDLSSNLKSALASFGLHGVLDTGSGSNRIKRPDIALYTDREAADVAGAADVVLEAKKPHELSAYASLVEALASDDLWRDKFVPYVAAHAERLSYFVLTTFERFLVVPVTEELRRAAQADLRDADTVRRRTTLAGALSLDLSSSKTRQEFVAWCDGHLSPAAVAPPPLSAIADLRSVTTSEALEAFASELADLVVGPEGRPMPGGALIASIQVLSGRLDDLAPEARRALTVYTMSAHGGMTAENAESHLQTRWRDELEEFVGASVHSLIGRLFAVKSIEDCFCVETTPPLLPPEAWVFHTSRFDTVEASQLPAAFFSALTSLSSSQNPAIRDMAATGRFYDWLVPQLRPAPFRRLLALFVSHSFSDLDGDLLGRFFEIYAQRVDRRRRRQLGQYYTPLPIVRHMWRACLEIARERNVVQELVALDPGVGSGTFLIEGANQLHNAGVARFWEKLAGFDISAQAIGIAQINLYLAVLAHLDRQEADAVGALRLYPTDALDPRNGARLRSIMPLLSDESTRAFLRQRIELSEQIKQRSRFHLIIGNPPYRNNSDQTLAQVEERFPHLLRSSRLNARVRERNIRDDYAWFFAAADHYVAGRGVIAFVVSDSFCYASSYRFFREDLLRRYHVRSLINLGAGVFRDVGPRTQFVIVLLERRERDLTRADEAGSLLYTDLRVLADAQQDGSGGAMDPRLRALDAGALPQPVEHAPTRARSFALFPASGLVARVEAVPNVLHGSTPRRVFLKKWPGLITAFDELFRADTRAALAEKMERFFMAAALDREQREAALDDFARTIRASSAQSRSRLSQMAELATAGGVTFRPDRLRRVVTGSAPNEVAWYPDDRLTSWVYYEPSLRVPRNVHEGRDPGFGTMSQWRDEQSHEIDPKFVFTTGTNPQHGMKALVVPGDWLVKSHGGESQQFHYTGLENPNRPPNLVGPNNLGDDALAFFNEMRAAGSTAEDFLFYLAGIYNSQTTEDYLEGGGANVMRIPLDLGLVRNGRAARVAGLARRLRNLHWLAAETTLEATLAESLMTAADLEALGMERQGGSGGRFRQRPSWQATEASAASVDADVNRL